MSARLDDVVQRVRRDVAGRLDELARQNGHGTAMDRRALITEGLQRVLNEDVRRGLTLLSPDETDAVRVAVEISFAGLGGFQVLYEDPTIEEIHANGCDNVWIRRAGDRRMHRAAPVASSDAELLSIARHVVQSARSRLDDEVPIAVVDLGDGTRFSASTLGRRPRVSICRPVLLASTLDELLQADLCDAGLRDLLRAIVRARRTLMLCGGHGDGKTTLLRALLGECEPWERKVTIEQVSELQLERFEGLHPNIHPLFARLPNLEGKGAITQSQLVQLTMVSRPDRIALGEVIGDEAVPLLKALSGGVDGCMATIHSEGPDDVWERLVLLAACAPERIERQTTLGLAGRAIKWVVHLGRDARGTRAITAVHEVSGFRPETGRVHTGCVYAPGPDGRARRTTTAIAGLERLVAAGLDAHWETRARGWTAPA